MPGTIRLDVNAHANQAMLARLRVTDREHAQTYTLDEVNTWHLGTHPDLVDYLAGLAAALPEACVCVINERSSPLLIHPQTGIIFGLAGGTGTLALRLPEPELSAARAVPGYGESRKFADATVYAKDFGASWVLLPPFDKGNPALVQKAYEFAGKADEAE